MVTAPSSVAVDDIFHNTIKPQGLEPFNFQLSLAYSRRSYKRLIRKMSKDPNVENVELTALWNVVKYRYPSLSEDEVWEELAPFYGDCTGDESIEFLGEYFLYKEVGELGIHDYDLLERAGRNKGDATLLHEASGPITKHFPVSTPIPGRDILRETFNFC